MVELNAQDARFRLAMASAGIGMAIVSLDGCWVDVNPALCRMFGYPAEALNGQPVNDLSHPDDMPMTHRLLQRLLQREGDAVEAEKRYLRADGQVIQVQLNSALMRGADGEPLYLISQLRDITAQREAEQAMRDINATLEARVQARTAELEAANRRLEAFAYGVSHDLRAPLRTIDGFAAQLERSAEDVLDEQAREHLQRIRGATAKMGGLIDSLLDLARINRSSLRPAQVDVSLLVEWVLAELQDAEPGRPVQLSVQPGLEMIGDERLLKLMLGELLGNAWKFSAATPRVAVAIEGRREQDQLLLTIRDHGIGFDMAYAAKLFEPFQRLHGGEDGAGNGIGLAIAEQVAARHGGTIRAEAALGEGATFHVQLCDLAQEQAEV